MHHQLIGFAATRIEDLEVVFSHPAALDQCRKLFKDYPNLSARVHWDTSGSVIHVKESGNKAWAAIAGELAAREYGMTILSRDIEDYPLNATRFALIAAVRNGALPHPMVRVERECSPKQANSELFSASKTYKECFAVELAHEVGALARLLNALADVGANLTKIESRPIGESPWHYHFFMDIEISSASMENELTAALKASSVRYKPLGRYFPALEISIEPQCTLKTRE